MSSSLKDARWALANKILLETLGKGLDAEHFTYADRSKALSGAQMFLEIIPEESIGALAEEWNDDQQVNLLSWTQVERKRIRDDLEIEERLEGSPESIEISARAISEVLS